MLLKDAGAPDFLWANAFTTAVYTINCTMNSSLGDITLFEAFFGWKPNVSHMRVWYSDVFVHRPKDLGACHDLQRSGACQTYFPWPRTRCVDPGSILAEQCTMLDEATKVGMQNTDAHVCAPSLFSSQCVYIYLTSTGNFPSLEIN